MQGGIRTFHSASQRLFSIKILFLPLTFFDQRYIGEIASRVRLNDQIAFIIRNKVVFAILDLIISTVYLAILFWYSVPLTLIAVTVAVINLVFLLRLSQDSSHRKAGFMAEPGDSRSLEQQVYDLYYFMTVLE